MRSPTVFIRAPHVGTSRSTRRRFLGVGLMPTSDPQAARVRGARMPSPRSWSAPAGIAALALAGVTLAFDAVRLEDYSGEELFLRFCASCHGSQAHGDGPVSRSLNVAVPDLTRITSRYGQFPAGLIRDVIDGRGIDTRAHGTREMPVWGYEFWIEEGAD